MAYSTCSELRRVQHPLSGTSHSLQIPESLKSHRARRGQATQRTGGVSQCAFLWSVEDTDWSWSVNPGGGVGTTGPALASSQLLPPDALSFPVHSPTVADSRSPSSPILPNTYSLGLS